MAVVGIIALLRPGLLIKGHVDRIAGDIILSVLRF